MLSVPPPLPMAYNSLINLLKVTLSVAWPWLCRSQMPLRVGAVRPAASDHFTLSVETFSSKRSQRTSIRNPNTGTSVFLSVSSSQPPPLKAHFLRPHKQSLLALVKQTAAMLGLADPVMDITSV